MGDYERRNYGPRGGFNNRKRRFNRDDDEFDRRPQRRRYEEPLHLKFRKQLLAVAESPLKDTNEEIHSIAQILVDNYFDFDIRTQFLEMIPHLIVEQPLKIPFYAAIIHLANPKKPDLTKEVFEKLGPSLQVHLYRGAWREVKLILRFFACLQTIIEGDGVFPVLSQLFDRAVDLQTASSEDSLGLELVKIILLTIPYIMASSGLEFHRKAIELLDKTDVIASTPHTLEALVNPLPGDGSQETQEPQPVVGLLQKQLQKEAEQEWRLACISRPWETAKDDPKDEDGMDGSTVPMKHSFPSVTVPSSIISEVRPRLPEIYLSVYADQEIETVPPMTDFASSILRDNLVDTINILDYNRNVTAKFLIDLDCYFAPETFVKRGTQFDKLRDIEAGKSTWKPEDVAVDAVFSQLMQLPKPEHKLVYYHSVLTEACKLAPSAIAPSLGRAIRWLYQAVDTMDLELVYRYMDWFSHHLSNFGFTWKWTEWVDDVALPPAHPKKAFIIGALEKEIRLSFASRIRGTLPEPYEILIPPSKEQDIPSFKYASDQTPYADPARQLLQMLKTKAPDAEIASGPMATIESMASEQGVSDPLLPSTDAYVTSICYLGSKSLSHMLSQIERCKERLLSVGPRSDPAARLQIIASVMAYWAEKPGIGVNVVDKLLNYTILTPSSVILWALGPENLGIGEPLMKAHVYEMVAATVGKVTSRVRQIVAALNEAISPPPSGEGDANGSTQEALGADQAEMLQETLAKEREDARSLFGLIDDAVAGIADGTADAVAESAAQDDGVTLTLLRRCWGRKWLIVFRRWLAVEEAWVEESTAAAKVTAENAAVLGPLLAEMEGRGRKEAVKMEGVESTTNGNGDADVRANTKSEGDTPAAAAALATPTPAAAAVPAVNGNAAKRAKKETEKEKEEEEMMLAEAAVEV